MSIQRVCLLLFLLLLPKVVLVGQSDNSQNDSLINYSSEEIIKKIGTSNNNFVRKLYSKTLLQKAKTEKDTTNIILSYDLLAFFDDEIYRITYLDSLISLSKIKDYDLSLSQGLIDRANTYFKNRLFTNALDDYLRAYEYALKTKDLKLTYSAQHGIGVLKKRIGDLNEALKIHKDNLQYFDNPSPNFTKQNHLNTIFSLSSTYKELNDLDSSTKYNTLGITLSKEYENEEMYNLFVLNEGTVLFHKNKIDSSLDSIQKARLYFEKQNFKRDLAFVYFYLGKIYLSKNKSELAIGYLKKVDTIFQQTNDIHPDLNSTYKLLSNYYKQQGDTYNQLNYLNRLITLDSTLNSYQSYLGKKLKNQYDMPQLIAERNEIINSLENKTLNLKYILLISFLIIVFSYIVFVYRQKILKKRFEKILNSDSNQKSVNANNQNHEKNEIPTQVINDIISKLEKFEKNNDFINSKLNLFELAKSLNTNSNYLSKVINTSKGVNFSTYLNDLRIDFAINKLKNSKSFKNYKISVIANEVGFNNPETFSRLFKKKTGIYPSYFIEQINKRAKEV